ncbi:gliding motility-associated C-terminal domain-containing protein [Mucilaginibacter ginsenosidivorax]|uniref:Gliding motility-associated C-terminal domain-containing protein n=1 Tax=Mucilaginibacter ginsenosidivorax TaxID=862126 RepID=A0A5B8W1W1_9SPHI|nr:gliding motility-associated C-terminal domain-containing protein [Mucilaginibacter ginsenosidivorax]QEC77731.1 gliding motility-associated C-terminal domain-containing protein [Mucilaginibacter ginsenosidivorax]
MTLHRIARFILLLLAAFIAIPQANAQQGVALVSAHHLSSRKAVLKTSASRKKIINVAPIFSFDYPDVLPKCDNVPLTLQVQGHPEYLYRWYKDGVLTTNVTTLYPIQVTGKYRAEISSEKDVWVSTKEVQVNVIYLPEPQILPDQPTHCGGSNAILNSNLPASSDYSLNWYLNGHELTQFTNKASISVSELGTYMLTVRNPINTCSKESPVYHLVFTPAPTFTFNYPGDVNVCQGGTAVLTVGGDIAYQYRWYKDGVLTGNLSQTLTTTQNGKYKVEVSTCPGTWIPSKEVQVNVYNLPTPVITPDKVSYCTGDLARLDAGITTDAAYSITWQRDGTTVTAWQNKPTVTTTDAGNYSVIVTSTALGTCVVNSAAYRLAFNPLPTVSITQAVTTKLCEGQPLELTAVHSAGSTVSWSTGETTDKISVSTTGTYSVTATSAAGCQAVAGIDLQFLPVAILNMADTSFCTYTGAPVTITAPTGFSKYTWNGVDGGNTFIADRPQTISLSVINANGCPSDKVIHVISSCPDIHIPSAFTPNGDGKNDTWNITGLETDASVLVKVFNRYGSIVFRSTGTTASWNGRKNGQPVPAGVYYYVISGKNGKQLFSGSITLLN